MTEFIFLAAFDVIETGPEVEFITRVRPVTVFIST
jgi:hypothetical protein